MRDHESEESDYMDVVNDSAEKKRTFWGLVTGGVGAVVGMFGGGAYITNKLIPFDREVAARTRNDIVGRGGLGAGISETGGFAAGAGNRIIEEAHALELIQNPEFSFAKHMRQLGGRGTAELLVAGAAGLAAMAAYFALTPKKEPQIERVRVSHSGHVREEVSDEHQEHTKVKDWQASVKQEPKAESQDMVRS